MTPALELIDVTVDYGGLRALADVNLCVRPGEVVGIIGPNGSGKTTLLDVVSGMVAPVRGAVLLDGIDVVDHLPEDRAALGLVRSFQDCRLYPELSVEETLLVALDARRPVGVTASMFTLPSARRVEAAKREEVDRVVTALGLQAFRHNSIDELSTGTRRIVDLASIVTGHPRTLLLDEPTSGIAQREAEAFGPLLRRLHEVTGAAVCLVEHDVRLVMSLSDRVVVMEAGHVVAEGTPAQVARDPAAVAAYLGATHEALARSGAADGGRRRRQLHSAKPSATSRRPRPLRAAAPRKETS